MLPSLLVVNYLQPGPCNRLLLSLKSGIGSQIDWALSRLATASYEYADSIQLEHFPGLVEILSSFPRRVCNAASSLPPSTWEPDFFEQDDRDRFLTTPGCQPPPRKRSKGSEPRLGALVSLASTTSDSIKSDNVPAFFCDFDPAHEPGHATLMRRAVEASLILRNLALGKATPTQSGSSASGAVPGQSLNAKHLVSVRGFAQLIKDVLEAPDVVLTISPTGRDVAPTASVSGMRSEEEQWLELEGIQEMRASFLDIVECIGSKIFLPARAPFEVEALGGEEVEGDESQTFQDLFSSNSKKTGRAAHSIFMRLLHFANHSSDRAIVVASLRCLSIMAANDKNEHAFIESEMDGKLSPGLLRRCIELLATSYDHELLEATLELLYQLVSIGNNALRLATRSITATATSLELAKQGGILPSVSGDRTLAYTTDPTATSGTLATVRLLVRALTINKSVWERDHPLAPNSQPWAHEVPSALRSKALEKLALADRKSRRHHERLLLSPLQRASEKKLTQRERRRLIGMKEPDRSAEWYVHTNDLLVAECDLSLTRCFPQDEDGLRSGSRGRGDSIGILDFVQGGDDQLGRGRRGTDARCWRSDPPRLPHLSWCTADGAASHGQRAATLYHPRSRRPRPILRTVSKRSGYGKRTLPLVRLPGTRNDPVEDGRSARYRPCRFFIQRAMPLVHLPSR